MDGAASMSIMWGEKWNIFLTALLERGLMRYAHVHMNCPTGSITGGVGGLGLIVWDAAPVTR